MYLVRLLRSNVESIFYAAVFYYSLVLAVVFDYSYIDTNFQHEKLNHPRSTWWE